MSKQILPHRTLETDQNQIIINNFWAEVRLHFVFHFENKRQQTIATVTITECTENSKVPRSAVCNLPNKYE